MANDKNPDQDKSYDNRVGGGRVADKAKGTVYSPRQIQEMSKKSDQGREREKLTKADE